MTSERVAGSDGVFAVSGELPADVSNADTGLFCCESDHDDGGVQREAVQVLDAPPASAVVVVGLDTGVDLNRQLESRA